MDGTCFSGWLGCSKKVVVPGVGARDNTGGHFGAAGDNGIGHTRTCASRVLAGGAAGHGEGLHGATINSIAGRGRVGELIPCGWRRTNLVQ